MKNKIIGGILIVGIIISVGFNVAQYTQGNKMEAQASALQSEIVALEESVSSIQSEVSDKETEKENLNKTISDLQNSLETLQSENDNLNKELEENKATLEEKAEQEDKSEEVVKSTEDNKQTSKGSTNSTTNNSTVDNDLAVKRESVMKLNADIWTAISNAQATGVIPADAIITFVPYDPMGKSADELVNIITVQFFCSVQVAKSADGTIVYEHHGGEITAVANN